MAQGGNQAPLRGVSREIPVLDPAIPPRAALMALLVGHAERAVAHPAPIGSAMAELPATWPDLRQVTGDVLALCTAAAGTGEAGQHAAWTLIDVMAVPAAGHGRRCRAVPSGSPG